MKYFLAVGIVLLIPVLIGQVVFAGQDWGNWNGNENKSCNENVNLNQNGNTNSNQNTNVSVNENANVNLNVNTNVNQNTNTVVNTNTAPPTNINTNVSPIVETPVTSTPPQVAVVVDETPAPVAQPKKPRVASTFTILPETGTFPWQFPIGLTLMYLGLRLLKKLNKRGGEIW